MSSIYDKFLQYGKWGAGKFTDLFGFPFVNETKDDGLKWHLQEIRVKTGEAISELESSVVANDSKITNLNQTTSELAGKIVEINATRSRNLVMVYDDLGKGSVMVRIPKAKMSDIFPHIAPGSALDVWHPAFLVNGVLRDCIYIGQFQCIVENNRAYSLPNQDPRTNIDFDTARGACQNKGRGWHLMTQVEWAFLSAWALKNNTQPRGNNFCGCDHSEKHETGVEAAVWAYSSNWNNRAYKEEGGSYYHTGRTLTGSGPNTWSHNHEEDGVFDLNGNVWEWVDGFKIINGVAHVQNDNDFESAENSWINTGVDICSGRSYGQPIKEIMKGTFGSEKVWESLCVPASTGTPTDMQGNYWYNAEGERVPLRGGYWGNGSTAGVFAFSLNDPRSLVHSFVGFRVAFVEI